METLDLAAIIGPLDVAALDLAPLLHRGLVVREKEFRARRRRRWTWTAFAGRHVAVLVPDGRARARVGRHARRGCASSPVAASVAVASVDRAARRALAAERVRAYDWAPHAGQPVVLKGCGTGEVPLDAFAQATLALQAVASRVMFGEPCSAVPVWRAPAGASRPGGAARVPRRAAAPGRRA